MQIDICSHDEQCPYIHPFSEVLMWFKALCSLVTVQTEREFLAPCGDDPWDCLQPLFTNLANYEAFCSCQGTTNNGDPSMLISKPLPMDDHSNITIPSSSSEPMDTSTPYKQPNLLCTPSQNRASPYLRSHCPHCFGGSEWGTDINM